MAQGMSYPDLPVGENGSVVTPRSHHGIPEDLPIGSNTLGTHPASTNRPVVWPEWSEPTASGYRIGNTLVGEPHHPVDQEAPRPYKVIMIGCGAAGIDFLHHCFTEKLLERMVPGGKDVEVVAYDKNPQPGGTWYENRYPGM